MASIEETVSGEVTESKMGDIGVACGCKLMVKCAPGVGKDTGTRR